MDATIVISAKSRYYPFPGVCKLFTRDRFPPQPIILVPSKFTSQCRMNLATQIYFLFCLWRSIYDVGASPMRLCQKYQEFVKNVTQKSHQNDLTASFGVLNRLPTKSSLF